MLNFTIPSDEQCRGRNKLDIFNKIGLKAQVTDFSRLLNDSNIKGEDNLYYGTWFTKTPKRGNPVCVVAYSPIDNYNSEFHNRAFIDSYYTGVRPAISISPSERKDFVSKGYRNEDGILEVEYGEYPQWVASDELQRKLDEAYFCGYPSLKSTGKKYTIDYNLGHFPPLENGVDEYHCKIFTFDEFLYQDGKKYAKVKKLYGGPIEFLDGIKYQRQWWGGWNGFSLKYVWVEVQPIKWLIGGNMALSKYILFSSVPFMKIKRKYGSDEKGYDGDFENTYMNKFLSTTFSRDIVPSNTNGLLDEIKADVDKALKLLNNESNNSDFDRPKLDFTFLTRKQCCGENRLSIFAKNDDDALMTDFAGLLGCRSYGGNTIRDYEMETGRIVSEGYGCYWAKDKLYEEDALYIGADMNSFEAFRRYFGARPATSYSSIRDYVSNGCRNEDGIIEVEYGEYPQQAASNELQEQLNEALDAGNLELTGKTYTIDSTKVENVSQKFKPQILEEYVFNNKRYVRVKANLYNLYAEKLNRYMFSNGKIYAKGDYAWVEVQPIKWLVDDEEDLAVSKYVLYAGIPFKFGRHYNGDFKRTDQKVFLDNIFSKEIVINKSLKETISSEETNNDTPLEQPKELVESREIDTDSSMIIEESKESVDEDIGLGIKDSDEDKDLTDKSESPDAEVPMEIPTSDNLEEEILESDSEPLENLSPNSNKQSNISNIEINLDNTIRVIQEALANGQKIELCIIEADGNQISKEEKRKIYTIK